MASFTMINISGLLIAMLIIMFIAAIFVYRDAKKRKMNALLWAFIGFIGPFLIGVIIYLVCRAPITEMCCPRCGAAVSSVDKNCPECNMQLMTRCSQCNFPIQRGWKTCPSCGAELPKDYEQPVRSYNKESGTGAIIGIVAGLVVLVLVAMFFVMKERNNSVENNEVSYSYSGFEAMYNITADDLSQNEYIASWLEEVQGYSGDNIYALMSDTSDTCIVYIKDSEKHIKCSIDVGYEGDECFANLLIEESVYEDSFGYDFLMYEMEVFEDTSMTAFIGDKEYDVYITYTDADISYTTWGGESHE